jgi:hypothetical protein
MALFLVVLSAYLAFPTRNYYWDGISFALQIEDAQGLEPMLFNPNHLGYDITGSMIWHLVRAFLPSIRALTVLVRMEWPYYRLFYLPAIIVLSACVMRRHPRFVNTPPTYRLAAFAGAMVVSNFVFLIYPFTKTGATPPLQIVIDAQGVWDRDAVVFYREFSTDNRMFKYFNRQARWEIVDTDTGPFRKNLCALQRKGYKTWIDSSGLDYLASLSNPEPRMAGLEFHDNQNLFNLKHRIHFMSVIPRCEEEAEAETPE